MHSARNRWNSRIRFSKFDTSRGKKVRSEESEMESWWAERSKCGWHAVLMEESWETSSPLYFSRYSCITENLHSYGKSARPDWKDSRAQQAPGSWILAKEHSNRKTSTTTTTAPLLQRENPISEFIAVSTPYSFVERLVRHSREIISPTKRNVSTSRIKYIF